MDKKDRLASIPFALAGGLYFVAPLNDSVHDRVDLVRCCALVFFCHVLRRGCSWHRGHGFWPSGQALVPQVLSYYIARSLILNDERTCCGASLFFSLSAPCLPSHLEAHMHAAHSCPHTAPLLSPYHTTLAAPYYHANHLRPLRFLRYSAVASRRTARKAAGEEECGGSQQRPAYLS